MFNNKLLDMLRNRKMRKMTNRVERNPNMI